MNPQTLVQDKIQPNQNTIRYCLYARKSMEPEERQAMSISQQINEMRSIAEREQLLVAGVRTEAHSAKSAGQREVFNKLVEEIQTGRFNGILTWAPDRLSRNAGDLGRVVDLMDNQLLMEIRTFNQLFRNSPNEKFLLMILGSQAKLENDNRGVNVKRGLRDLAARGLRSGIAPIGYKNSVWKDKRGLVTIDVIRAHVIKLIFEKGAEGWSYRRIRDWLKKDLDFRSPHDKHLSLSAVQHVINTPFYYGEFEYPKGSGNWYKGVHTPIVTKELFEAAQKQFKMRKHATRIYRKIFAFSKLLKCGLCGSNTTAEEKFKLLKDGSIAKYVYYGCTRAKNPDCKLKYIREAELIEQLCVLVDKLTLDDLGVRGQFDLEVERMYRFHRDFIGNLDGYESSEQKDLDTKKYVKYLLAEGTIEEKRRILSNLRSKLILKDRQIRLDTIAEEEAGSVYVENDR